MMKKTIAAIVIALTAVMAAALPTQAQDDSYKWDIGAGVGMSGYLGDTNTSNMFKSPGFAVSASMRYLINPRWALRGVFTTLSLSGNSAGIENVWPGGETYEFKSQVYDLSVRGEANFFNYGIGETYKKLRRWTPYAALGIGATLSSCDGETAVGLSLPMSVGVKYKLMPRLNLALEFTMTKVFGDKVDGKDLDDLYQIKSSFLKNTDWHSSIMVSITYEFGKRCVTCHYVD